MAGINSNTVLCLHADGTDASTTFTDSSTANTKTVTANNQAQIDTAQKVFGTASGLFDGTADYLSVPDSSNWSFGTGDWTIDFRVRFNSVTGAQSFFQYRSDATHRTEFLFYPVLGGANPLTHIGVYSNNAGTEILNSFSTLVFAPVVNTWYHIALVRTGNTLKCFVGGSEVVGSGISVTGGFVYTGTQLEIGYRTSNSDLSFNGWYDEYRIQKGEAAWTANFTPPTEAYSVATATTPSGSRLMMGVGV